MSRAPFFLVAIAIAGFACGTTQRDVQHSRLEPVAGGTAPLGFTAAETNGAGRPAAWRIEADQSGPPSATSPANLARVAPQNTGETYNVLLSDASYAADVRVQVAMRVDGGVEDMGGGVVWRALDANTYYLARWNPIEKNVRVYHVIDGKRTLLGSVDAAADAAGWHELAVWMHGDALEVRFDGARVLELTDGRITGGGRVGLWTKADAATSFRAFAVES